MISVAVVDDELEFRQTVCAYLARYEQEQSARFQVECFADGLDVAEDYRSKWDIISLDIAMERMNGMEAARRIRRQDAQVVLIFITTLAQYALNGYEVDTLDFVLKPLSYAQFEMRLRKAVRAVEKLRGTKSVYLRKWSDWVRVSTDDILYVEVRGHDLRYVTPDEVYEKRATIGEAEAELAGMGFAKCSKSFLVNLKRIDRIRGDAVVLGECELPISRSRKKEFLQQFADYLEAEY